LITNLLFNAVDARRVDQESARIQVRTRDDGSNLFLEVSDDGIGMTASVKERIFEPFYTYGKNAGSGLGLSICVSLLARVNGKIDVESVPNKGCTFKMTIPLANTSPLAQPSHVKADIQTILVIDDDPVLPELIAEILLDFQCLFADNVDDAQRILETHQIDAIVCDVNMPCGGASSLHSHLKAHEHLLAERMVVITGGAVTVEMQSFIETTAQPVIYKPFRAQQITEALASLS
jgi:CheY-like chemotaxis protein